MNEQTTEVKKKGKGKIILILLIALPVITGALIGLHFYFQGTNYVVTENARITTTLVTVTPTVTGILETFTIYEGRYVRKNEIIGWIENIETFRSPFDGLVVRSYVSQNQVVSPLEPLAVIADINNLHIQANIEETYITRIHRGQTVSVTIDAFGNRQFTGYVSEIGRITDAEISGSAMFFNTGGNFTKVTQIIPVKIKITDDINLENFIGLNARVRIALNEPVGELTRVTTNNIRNAQRRSVYTTLGLTIERINVQIGDTVSEGQILCIFDDMDISHLERSIIRSPINGRVTAIFAREGAVGMGLLFVIEEDADNMF